MIFIDIRQLRLLDVQCDFVGSVYSLYLVKEVFYIKYFP
jgi:hypothetical protein